MIIVNDFFKRKKEAVSMQMEFLKDATNGKIITATRFMKQKAFKKKDRDDNIYVYPPFIYRILLFFNILFGRGDIHIFEEEPSFYKRFICNLSKKRVYISMYREPFEKYAEHLKKYKNLSGVFVEMDYHKDILKKLGISEDLIFVSYTPSKLQIKKNTKNLDINHVNLLFASWNNAEGDPLNERGLIYILDLLTINQNFRLTVILRDNDTYQFIKELKKRNLGSRVKLLNVTEEELIKEFDKCDFVIYAIQKKLTKDVPNSIVDGLTRGKPAIISSVFGYSRIVKKYNVGYVIEPNTKPIRLEINNNDYMEMSNRAFELAKMHTKNKYVNNIINHYKREED